MKRNVSGQPSSFYHLPSFHQSIHFSIIRSVHPYIYLCIHQISSIHTFSILQSVDPYIYLSIHPSIHSLTIFPSIHLSTHPSIYLSIHPSVYISIYLSSVCPSIHPFIHLNKFKADDIVVDQLYMYVCKTYMYIYMQIHVHVCR